MNSQSFIPSLPLRPYVEEYTFLQSDSFAPITQNLPPGGRSGILFNLGSDCRVDYVSVAHSHFMPTIAVGGQLTQTLKLTYQSGCQMLLITFRTYGLYKLFGAPIHELSNQLLDVELVFPPLFRAQWRSLLEQLREVQSLQQRIRIIETQLLVYVRGAPTIHRNWIRDASLWLAQPGNSRIQTLATELRISPRQLSREFSRQVGIAPKSFLQVMRFRNVFRVAYTQNTYSWMDLVHLGGWYDQAHFCNDIYELTGLTPTAFFDQYHATKGLLMNNHDLIT